MATSGEGNSPIVKFEVEVTQTVMVELDESKFDDAFMASFRDFFYPFHTVKDHATHLAQLAARGLLNEDFVEGYGPLAAMGIKVTVLENLRCEDVREE